MKEKFNDLFVKQQMRLNRTTGRLFEDLNNRVVDLERVQLLTFIYMVVNLLVVFGLWLIIGVLIK